MISMYDHPSNLDASELLTEETMINPNTPLPSYLEMRMIDSTFVSGQQALSSSLDAIINHFQSPLQVPLSNSSANNMNSMVSRLKQRIGIFLSRYVLEIQALITYFIERQCLSSKSAGGGTLAESLFGAMRSKVVPVTPVIQKERDGSESISNNGVISSSDEIRNKTKNTQASVQTKPNDKNVMALLPMTEKDCIRSAFVMAFLPYIQNKLHKIYQDMKRFREQDNGDSHNNYGSDLSQNQSNPISRVHPNFNINFNEKLKRLFFTLYPYLHMTQQGVTIYYQYSYLLGYSIYYSPSLAFLKQMVRRITLADRNRHTSSRGNNEKKKTGNAHRTLSSTSSKSNTLNTSSNPIINSAGSSSSGTGKVISSNKSIESIMKKARSAVLISLTSLYLGACFMKLREERKRIRRRYRLQTLRRNLPEGNVNREIVTENSAMNDRAQIPPNDLFLSISLPPPPKPPSILQNVSNSSERRHLPINIATTQLNICPLCNNEFINPAVSTSGYVFCYRCLVQYIREEQEACPITGKYCSESDIIRIYESG